MPESYPLTYVQTRRRADGRVRFYFCPPAAWRRAGIRGERLPDDEGARVARHLALVRRAERATRASATSFSAYAELYQRSPAWAALAPRSRANYATAIRLMVDRWADFDVTEIDRPAAVALQRLLQDRPAQANRAVAVLRNILNLAHDDGAIAANPCQGLRRLAVRGRDQVFTIDDCAAWLRAAARHPLGPEMILHFTLMRFTGQRVNDCLRMPWTAWDGSHVMVRQEKRGALVRVMAVRELKDALDAAPRRAVTIVASADGRPVPSRLANRAFRAIRQAAGLDHLQARDLRRTAVVNLALAGATETEIRHITGHRAADAARMLEDHYLPHQQAIADNAIVRLEAWMRGKNDK